MDIAAIIVVVLLLVGIARYYFVRPTPCIIAATPREALNTLVAKYPFANSWTVRREATGSNRWLYEISYTIPQKQGG